jgi:hypothetical protein
MIHPTAIISGSLSNSAKEILLKTTELGLTHKVIQAFDYIVSHNTPAQTDYFAQTNELPYHDEEIIPSRWSYYVMDEVDVIVVRKKRYSTTIYTRIKKVVNKDEGVEGCVYSAHNIDTSKQIRVHPLDVECSELFCYLNNIKDDLIEGVKKLGECKVHVQLGNLFCLSDFMFIDYQLETPYREGFLGDISKSLSSCEELFALYYHQYLKHSIPRIISKLKVGQKLPGTGEPLYKIKSVQGDEIELSVLRSRINPKRAIVIGPEDLLTYYLHHLPVEWIEKAQ